MYKEYYDSRIAARTQEENDEDALAEYLAGGDIPVETVNWGTGSGSGSASALARAGATNQNAYMQALLAQAPGQYLRVNYELRVNMSPFSSSVGGRIPAQYPSFTGWTTGSLDREAIQKIGLCGIDSGSGLAIPIDEGGFCNEPFAPGQISFELRLFNTPCFT